MNTNASPLSDIAGLASRLTAKALKSLGSVAGDKAQDLIFRNVMTQQGLVGRLNQAAGNKNEFSPPDVRNERIADNNDIHSKRGNLEAKRNSGKNDEHWERRAMDQDAESAATDTGTKRKAGDEPAVAEAQPEASGPAEGEPMAAAPDSTSGRSNTMALLPLDGPKAQPLQGEYSKSGAALPLEGELLPPGENMQGALNHTGKAGLTAATFTAPPLSGTRPGESLAAEVKALSASQAGALGAGGGVEAVGSAATGAAELNKTGFGAGLMLQNLLRSGTASTAEAKLISATSAAKRQPSVGARDAVQTLLTKLGSQPAVQQYQSVSDKAAAMQTGVQIPIGDPKWQAAVHERVMWLASQNITSAEIHLDPPELGPLQVKISMAQEQAQVTFTSHHASVREALDQGAYRLREMFEDRGLNLVNVDVSDDRSFDQGSEAKSGRGSGGFAGEGEEVEAVVTQSPLSSQLGLVDHYV